MEAAADWVQYAIDQPMADEPDSRFNYSCGATELLVHIFRVAKGLDIEEYAAKNLFAPAGGRSVLLEEDSVGTCRCRRRPLFGAT